MKVFALLFISVAALAQPVITGTNPQVQKGGVLYNIGTVTVTSGTGAPGTVANSQQGDFYLDTAAGNTYQCFASPGPCTMVVAGNWVLISTSTGSFTNLVTVTAQVTSPLFNALSVTGGAIFGGSLGVTGGVTDTTGFTTTSNSSSFGALILTANNTAALHLTNGGITIDAPGSITAINTPGNIIAGSIQSDFLAITNTSTFGNNVTVTGAVTASNAITGNGILSTGGITASGNIVSTAGQVRAGGSAVTMLANGSFQWNSGAGNLDTLGDIIITRATTSTAQNLQWIVGGSVNSVGSYRWGPDSSDNVGLLAGTGSGFYEPIQFAPNGLAVFQSGPTLGGLGSVGLNLGCTPAPTATAGAACFNDGAVSGQNLTVFGGGTLRFNRPVTSTVQQIQFVNNANSAAIGSYTIGTSGVTSGNLGINAGNGSTISEIVSINDLGLITTANTGGIVTNTGTFNGTVIATNFVNSPAMPTTCTGHPSGTLYNTTTSGTGGGTVVGVCP
jgi:hypothetical protein